MNKASFASMVLARFDEIRCAGTIEKKGEGALFREIGADVRAAGTDPFSQSAFKFVLYGLHDSESAARESLDERFISAPWLTEAQEVWCGVLAPFRHFGEANFLDAKQPGQVFDAMQPEPPTGTPIVVVTSAGFKTEPEIDLNRAREFGAGVGAVRISMTGVPGLHSQQSFFFPGAFVVDGITVTFWRDFAAMRDFAYGPGLHRNQVKRQRDETFADRTSFTRFAIVHSLGTWHGTDPLRPELK